MITTPNRSLYPATVLCVSALCCMAVDAQESSGEPSEQDPMAPFRAGRDQTEALRVNEAIYQATGFGNTFMVTTSEGNVIIDTSIAFMAPRHKQLLTAVNDGPVKYIILTHAHGDHTGGVPLWKGPETEVIAQANHVEFRNYQHRLRGFFARRNAAQFPALAGQAGRQAMRVGAAAEDVDNYGAEKLATILFEDDFAFELGGLTFQIFHTPGETYDHLTVWIPELKAAFTGDNFYSSFPNMYTLRGTKPRWALDYVESLNKVLELEPGILLPSHGTPIQGTETVAAALTKYRDAILHVHDATVLGMNQGKDVFTLMREISLPPELDVGEGYGTIAWSVRGIYEGYVGWFDGDPGSMYTTPQASIYPDLVEMAGGADKVAERAQALADEGMLAEALHMTDAALEADPAHEATLNVRLGVLEKLLQQSSNANETGWLEHEVRIVTEALEH